MAPTALPDYIQQMVHQIATDNGFKKPRAELEGGSEQGDNYVGQVFRTFLHDDGEPGKKVLPLIIKWAPQNAARRQLLRTHELFKNEIFMYETVLPAFLQALKSRGIVPKTQEEYPCTARLYGQRTSEDGAEDTLILQNVAPEGYLMGDRFAGMDGVHCRLVVQHLAKLHATSLILQADKPDLFNSLVANATEILCVPEWEPSFKGFADRARPMINSRFPIGTPGRDKFEVFVGEFYKNMCETVKPDPRLSVFCHGDTWINNYLFKYKENSTVPEQVFLVDFQVARYCNPVPDLAYMISVSTTKDVRDKHLKQLLRDYHDFLTSYLIEFGFPQDKIVSWDVMQDMYRKYMKFGLGMAIIGIPIFLSKKGDMHGVDEVGDAKRLDDLFVDQAEKNLARDQRLSDVLQHMIEYGYI